MAAMTMKSPGGYTVRTRAKRRYALVVDEVTFGGTLTGNGTCILRTDNPRTAVHQAKFYASETGRPCWIYNTVAKRREYI